VSSQGGLRGMPAISVYSASKGALERWAESMAGEIAPFGLGVTIIVTGTFDTDIITEQTADYRNHAGPYAPLYEGIDRLEGVVQRVASPPERFAAVLARALDDPAPFARRAAGFDARMLLLLSRVLPERVLHHVVRIAMRLPRSGALRGGAR